MTEQEVCSKYRDGASLNEIAALISMSQEYVRKVLKRNNVARRNYKNKISKEQEQEICDMYKSGEEQEDIGHKFGVSKSKISSVMKSCGVKVRGRKRHLKNIEKNVCQDYINGLSTMEIAKKNGCCDETVRKVLIKHEVDRRQETPHREDVSQDERLRMGEMYKGGMDSVEIANVYHMAPNNVRRILRKNQVEIRPVGFDKKLYVDESVFDEINEESAYWLGMLITDGWVCNNENNRYVIGFGLQDKEHIEKYKKFIKSEHSISEKPNFYTLVFTSQKLFEILGQYGIVPRKSHIAQCSSELKNNRHFWRGVIDGDGYVSSVVTLYGSKFMVEELNNYVKRLSGKSYAIGKNRDSYTLQICSNSALVLLDKLYMNAKIYLNRKYDKAMKILGETE